MIRIQIQCLLDQIQCLLDHPKSAAFFNKIAGTQQEELAALQTFRAEEFDSQGVKLHFQLARALAVLRIKATTFHALYTSGKHDDVSDILRDDS